MRLYFNLDENRTIRFRDMDTDANTWSATQENGEVEQILEIAKDLIDAKAPLDSGYTFSSDLDFPQDYGFAGDDDAHSIVQQALAAAQMMVDAKQGIRSFVTNKQQILSI